MKDFKVGVVGLWHLGCVISASWSKLGLRVKGFDHNLERLEKLRRGVLPVYEPGLKEILVDNVQRGRLDFVVDTAGLSDCDFIFLTYDTPVLNDDSSDTTLLEQSIVELGGIMKDSAVLVVSSQSPVGFCSRMRKNLKEKNPSLDISYSPENLRLGEAIECYLKPDRIILGTNNRETEKRCVELFSMVTTNVIAMSLESAEMVKHGINSFLASSIVFANNLADLCEYSGANIKDVVKGMKSDPRIGSMAYLSPGIGFSGGTLGRDLKVLDQRNSQAGGEARLFGFIHESNAKRKEVIVSKIEGILDGLEQKHVGILGLTYKPGTSTLRRSLPLEIAHLLLEKKSVVKVYDPKADYSEIDGKVKFGIAKDIEEVSARADILVLLTEWEDFLRFDWITVKDRMNAPNFFDAKNALSEMEMTQKGFHYYSLGKG